MERNRVILLQEVVGGLLMGSMSALFSSGLIWGMMSVMNFAPSAAPVETSLMLLVGALLSIGVLDTN